MGRVKSRTTPLRVVIVVKIVVVMTRPAIRNNE